MELNQESFEENLKNNGYFVIVSSINDEPAEILDLYRNRDSIGKCFRTLKLICDLALWEFTAISI